jgi:hypothetical protein
MKSMTCPVHKARTTHGHQGRQQIIIVCHTEWRPARAHLHMHDHVIIPGSGLVVLSFLYSAPPRQDELSDLDQRYEYNRRSG